MSPLDSKSNIPNLKGEDGEGSLQVKLDPSDKIAPGTITEFEPTITYFVSE